MRFPSARRTTALAGLGLLLAGCQPSGPEALIRGDRELQAGHTAEAVRLLELAATKLPTDARAWNHLGLAYHSASRPAEARKAYLRALEFDRNYSEVQFNLGQLELELGNSREAEAAFRAYLAADPSNTRQTEVWRGLGQALQNQRQFAPAEFAFNNLLQLDAQDPDAWNRIGLVRIQLRKYRDASQAFANALRLDPALASARLNLAVTAHQYLGDRRAALQHYRDYLATQPADPEPIRRTIQELEVKLGLVRTEAPAPLPTNPPPALVTRPTNAVVPTPLVPTNRAPLVVVRTNPPRPVVLRSNPPPAIAQVTPSPPAVPVTNPPTPPVVVAPRPAVTTPVPPTVTTTTPPPADPAPTVPNPVVVSTEVVSPVLAPPPVVVQVVPVSEDPPPRTAQDINPTPALPVTRPPDTVLVRPVPAPVPVPIPPPAVVTPAPSSDPEVTVAATTAATEGTEAGADQVEIREPGRRTFWQKANPISWGNPARWFRKDGSRIQPVAATPEPARTQPATPALGRVTPLTPPAPNRPVFARYESTQPRLVATGQRGAADAEFQRGSAAHLRRELGTAEAAYQRAVQLDPTHFEAQHNLSIAALERNDLPTALRAGESAVALQPDSLNARYNFAVALQRSRYPEDAAEQLTRVTELRPTEPNAHLALAGLYAGDLEDADRARREYQKVLEIAPDHPQSANIRRWLERNPGP